MVEEGLGSGRMVEKGREQWDMEWSWMDGG
jgi:hypothetical protein